jgi:hypothetical protein
MSKKVLSMLDNVAANYRSGASSARSDMPKRLRLGSPEHLQAFCRMLLDTHDPYRPRVLDWPKLEPDAMARLQSLPIWDIAVKTEGLASSRVNAYAQRVFDPLLRQAVELNGFEEGRHKTVLANLVEAYGIKLAPEQPYPDPRHVEWAFMVTGYSECIDSFFAFGLFELAKRSGFFPTGLVSTFEPVMKEEARHILFFVNWAVWHRRNLPYWRRPLFQAKIAAVWAFLIWERIGLARGVDAKQDNNFTVSGSRSLDINVSLADVIDVCLTENARRMEPYDPRLLRPTFVPQMAQFARWLLVWPKRRVKAAAPKH